MKILTINQYINERKEIKRKYTEKFPSLRVNKRTKIKNAIIWKIGEMGEMNLADFKNYLKSEEDNVTPSSSWFSNNKKYFKIIKRSQGVCCKLSKLGNRVYNMLQQKISFN